MAYVPMLPALSSSVHSVIFPFFTPTSSMSPESLCLHIHELSTPVVRPVLSLLQDSPDIFLSWGVTSMQHLFLSDDSAHSHCLRFHVNGFKHVGWVRVEFTPSSEFFSVIIESDGTASCLSSSEKSHIDRIPASNLASVVDSLVEKTEDYETTVINFIDSLFD